MAKVKAKKTRTPSRATLLTRAYGKVAQLDQKIEQTRDTRVAQLEKYDDKIKALEAELSDARAELKLLQDGEPEEAADA